MTWRSIIGAILAAGVAGSAAAQEATRARQAELFAAMLEAPDDAALMLEYARVSVALEDFEAAISTFERALIFQPGDPAILTELGAAYFRLGSYAAAKAYFDAALAGGVTPIAEARIEDYLDAIESRTGKSRFSGVVSAGLTYSSNATLGPDDPNVVFGGSPAVLRDEFTEEASAGIRLTGDVRHAYDLGRPNLDSWQTDLSFYSVSFFDTDVGDVASLGVTTGPSLALDDTAFGPRARPFVGARTVRSQTDPLFNEVGVGSDFSWGIDRTWSVFGRAAVGYRDYLFDRNDFDATFLRGVAGAAYAIDRRTAVFGTLLLDYVSADADAQSSFEYGLRVSAAHDYLPPVDLGTEPWSLRGFVQISRRDYDVPDPNVDPGETRDDTDLRIGASNLFRIHKGFGLLVDVDAIRRDSSIENFEFDSIAGTVSAVFEF